jgi:hypothetical protein
LGDEIRKLELKRSQVKNQSLKAQQYFSPGLCFQLSINKYRDLCRFSKYYAERTSEYFASQFLAKLPREVRDMIYMELILDSCKYRNLAAGVTTDFWGQAKTRWCLVSAYGTFGRQFVRRRGDQLVLPHFLDKDLLGTQFVAEIAECVYRHVEFHIYDPKYLIDFLDHDMFGVVRTPRHYVYHLTITLPGNRDAWITKAPASLDNILDISWSAAARVRFPIPGWKP